MPEAPTAHEDNVRAAANMIAGATAPTWFVEAVARQISRLASYVASDDVAPKRQDHRAKLEDLEKHARRVKSLLDADLLRRLQKVSDHHSQFLDQLPVALDDLLERLEIDARVVGSTSRSGDQTGIVPISAGVVAYFITGEQYAASSLVGMWKAYRGGEPGPYSAVAHDATGLLWSAAGGRGGRNWRRMFENVERPSWAVDEAFRTICTARLLAA